MNNVLFMDYGHGGSDSGAVANGVVEKSANLVTGLSCTAELRRHGVKVYESRTTDVFVSLADRVNMANKMGATYFVSIHHNAGGGDRGEGIHSVYRGKGQALANAVLDEMAKELGQQKKVYEKMGEGNKDYYYVIRESNMDAIIVEVCFLDNKLDVQIADTVAEQKRNGVVIAHGILKQMGIVIKGDYVVEPVKPIKLPNPLPPPMKGHVDVFYKVYSNGVWYPEVKNTTDYAGVFGRDVECILARLSRGSIEYRVSPINGSYYPWVKDYSDFAGVKGKNIDRLQMRLIGLPNHKVRYRVKLLNGVWLPWVIGTSDFAGVVGKGIEAVEVDIF